LPALQLGPGDGDWVYDNITETWTTGTNPFSLFAYANSDTAGADGSFAWDAEGAGDLYAYLVVSAVPMVDSDLFDVTVTGDGGALSLYASGFGAPPVQDDDSLPSHGIFDTYFEIYRFQFDGLVGTIGNTQPGGSGSGDGYAEEFDVLINSLGEPVTGVHFDLFVTEGDGTFDPNAAEDSDKSLVNAFAPFSHDAQANPNPRPVPDVPEPASLNLLILLLTGLAFGGRRRWRNRSLMA
jgi:hypothetical protein